MNRFYRIEPPGLELWIHKSKDNDGYSDCSINLNWTMDGSPEQGDYRLEITIYAFCAQGIGEFNSLLESLAAGEAECSESRSKTIEVIESHGFELDQENCPQ